VWQRCLHQSSQSSHANEGLCLHQSWDSLCHQTWQPLCK
jgi:hypothetical protein